MRRIDQDDVSDDLDPSSVGAGFGTAAGAGDLTAGYGTDDGFYEDSYEDSADDSFEDEDDINEIDDERSPNADMSEEEAEEILEDVLEDSYGSDADEMVDDLQDETGMSATELLEAITGIDIDGSEDGSSSDSSGTADSSDSGISPFDGNPFELAEMPEADLASEPDFDLNSDGHVDQGDLAEASHPFDFDVSD